jgi:DHA1 family inner membrane transport protein
VLLGGFGFATVPGLQMRVMKYASGAPTLASGANIGAFNVGNALGAWMGGVTITAGFGYTSPIWAGAVLTLLGLGVMLLAAARTKRTDAITGPAGVGTESVQTEAGAGAESIPTGAASGAGASAADAQLQRS